MFVLSLVTNEVRNEESWLVINLGCNVSCLFLESLAEAQQPKKIPRIGYLAADPGAPTRESFRQGLRDLGYVEGQSIHIEWRFTEDKPDRFSELAAELARLKVDAIVSGASVAVAILQAYDRYNSDRHGNLRWRSCSGRHRDQLCATREGTSPG